MYPYHEDSAGKFKSSKKTGNPAEALLASKDILSLAKEILPEPVYLEAERFASMLTSSPAQKKIARLALINILLPPPKRPVYYLAHELEFLPRWTREPLRIMGDYIDMLTKAATYEKTRDAKIFRVPFGPAIDLFAKCYPNDTQLADCLLRYNRFLYRDAKHDFVLPAGRREHRFTSREVVLCLYTTRELADRIKSLSTTAMRVSLDQPMNI